MLACNESIPVEIIGRHQHGINAQARVSASKLRKIHIFANGNAESRAFDRAYDIFVTRLEPSLETRHQMLFGIVGDQFTRLREQQARFSR